MLLITLPLMTLLKYMKYVVCYNLVVYVNVYKFYNIVIYIIELCTTTDSFRTVAYM